MIFAIAVSVIAATMGPAHAAPTRSASTIVPRTLPNLGPAGNGRRLFVEYGCYLCHGGNGGGQFAINIQGAEVGDINEAVHGDDLEAGMPSFAKYLTAKNVSDIAAYLRSVGTAKEPKWWNWWEANPTQ